MGKYTHNTRIIKAFDLIHFSLAALEMYESDLETMQQRAELQDTQLLALREQKLIQVRKAT